MDLGYCSLQVGWKWQWPLSPSARDERRVVGGWSDEQQSGVRRSGEIVEGAVTIIHNNQTINQLKQCVLWTWSNVSILKPATL